MSYEAWRREVAIGRMADWDEDKNDYADAPPRGVCGSCVNRMVNDPPTKPFTKCVRCGRGLPWFDPDTMDPERGYRAWDDDGSEDDA